MFARVAHSNCAGGCRDVDNNFGRDPGSSTDRCSADLAVQPWLGLLPQRRRGADRADSRDFAIDGTSLIPTKSGIHRGAATGLTTPMGITGGSVLTGAETSISCAVHGRSEAVTARGAIHVDRRLTSSYTGKK